MYPYDHAQHGSGLFVMFVVLGIVAIGMSVISLIVDLKLDIRKQDNDRLIGRERNEAFREIAAARNGEGQSEFDEKDAKLDMAALQNAISVLDQKYQEIASQRSELEGDLARALAELEQIKKRPSGAVAQIVASLGDPDVIEEPSLDSEGVVFDEELTHQDVDQERIES